MWGNWCGRGAPISWWLWGVWASWWSKMFEEDESEINVTAPILRHGSWQGANQTCSNLFCWGSGLGLYRLESQACQVTDVSSVGFAAFGFQVSFFADLFWFCVDSCWNIELMVFFLCLGTCNISLVAIHWTCFPVKSRSSKNSRDTSKTLCWRSRFIDEISIPSRENIPHILPWGKENHRLKSALGGDMWSFPGGYPSIHHTQKEKHVYLQPQGSMWLTFLCILM